MMNVNFNNPNMNYRNKPAFGGFWGKKAVNTAVDEGKALFTLVDRMLYGKIPCELTPEMLLKATEIARPDGQKRQILTHGVRLAIKQGRLSEQVVREAFELGRKQA